MKFVGNKRAEGALTKNFIPHLRKKIEAEHNQE